MARLMPEIEAQRDEVISMALSDKVSFDAIEFQFGIKEDELKRLMRGWLKRGSYRAWRRRVESFREQRGQYKAD